MDYLLIIGIFYLFFISISCVSAVGHVVSRTDFSDIQTTISGSVDGDTILLGNKVYMGSGSQTVVSNKMNLTISGSSNSDRATLNARSLSRIVIVDDDFTVTFRFVNFINGNSGSGSGGAIAARNTIDIENCTIRDNTGVVVKLFL
ncbi:hypothetical protein ALNOE001_06400 [Candidatus Methanobinarius endosymbioticus]|uniref:Right handed beta helix domain-containing protein n=1 Tax=Candidatus Methanobinarius endosymbioticus TaxID=2006182 RepID=A0A366MED2_9EURY|nr:hypothetical protein ALNOE001_06400 [Candidatus Methanobinarius endosymbioticus]